MLCLAASAHVRKASDLLHIRSLEIWLEIQSWRWGLDE